MVYGIRTALLKSKPVCRHYRIRMGQQRIAFAVDRKTERCIFFSWAGNAEDKQQKYAHVEIPVYRPVRKNGE